MLDPHFDPYQELIDLRIEFMVLTQNLQSLIEAHNRINHLVANQTREQVKQLKYIQQQQILIAKLQAELDHIVSK